VFRAQSCQEKAVIVTAFRLQSPKLSRKCGYCDRFQDAAAKVVKKVLMLTFGVVEQLKKGESLNPRNVVKVC
jgi:hypothetical protein